MRAANENWDDMIKQSYEYPSDLSGVEARLKGRIARNHKKRSAFITKALLSVLPRVQWL